MLLFGGFGTGPLIKGPFDGDIFDRGPSITEKIDMLFTDVETEGKKQGYKKAASEYEKAFRAIEKEYKETKELIEFQKSNYGNQSDELITKLSELEKQEKLLEERMKIKAKDVSTKYDIPIGDVLRASAAGMIICGITPTVSILDLIYNHKEKKLKEAEQRGYLEAKSLYEKKIAKMKKGLQQLKEIGSADIKNLLEMISDLFEAIAEKQMKIADLKILIGDA